MSATKPWDIKWREPIGDPECPYMTRWILALGLFTIRLHHFHRSDDDRHLHDHPWWFVSLLLRGTYREWIDRHPNIPLPWRGIGSLTFRPAQWRHRVEIRPGESCWTLCITGRISRVWGFWDKTGFVPSAQYLAVYGKAACE